MKCNVRRVCYMMTSHLDYTFSGRRWRAVQEAVIKRVPLGEAQPLWEVWEVLPVALKNHGVIVQTSGCEGGGGDTHTHTR